MGKSKSRHLERAKAFQVLYALDYANIKDASELRNFYLTIPDEKEASEEEYSFAWKLVHGTWSKVGEVDELINKYSLNWRKDRIGRVELTLLRLAMFELVFYPDTPARVATNEALELTARFGDLKSKGFINGILDAAIKDLDLK